MSWSDGYPVNVSFPDQVVRPALPASLSVVSLLNGHAPIAADRPLRYLELACGTGRTSAVVAATWPGAQVWACDINPSHVEEARRLAEAAGLDNCTFAEASFADVLSGGLGPAEADVIVVMGIWSWLSPQNQDLVLHIVAERLAVGGIVCLNHSVTSGNGSFFPLREVMRLAAAADPGPLAERVPRALDLATALVTAMHGAEAVERLVDPIRKMSPEYVAHDYLSPTFRPSTFAHLHDQFERARCGFLGAAEMVGHIANLSIGEPMIDTVVGTDDVVMRETLRDLSLSRTARTDLFRRGVAQVPSARRDRWLEAATFVSLGKEFDESVAVKVPVGEANLNEQYHGATLRVLGERPTSLGELHLLPIFDGLPFGEVVSVVGLLVAGGYAAPVVPSAADPSVEAATRRLNLALLGDNRDGAMHPYLVSPLTGCDVPVEFVESLSIAAMWELETDDPGVIAQQVFTDLQRQGRSVIADGEAVTDKAQAMAVLEAMAAAAVTRANGPLALLGIRGQ